MQHARYILIVTAIAALAMAVLILYATAADLRIPPLHRPPPPATNPFLRGLSIFTPPEHRPMGVAIGKDSIKADKKVEGAVERPAGMP
jgi:hypothetical protein